MGTASTRRRNGSVYVLIIGVSMLAATITIAALLAGRSQARALDGANNASEARSYAQAAVDLGRAYIAANSNWRTARSNGNWIAATQIGNGTLSLDVVNPAGALNRADQDSILLTGTGTCGTSVQRVQTTLTPTIKPYTCLSTAMICNGTLTMNGADLLTAGVLVSTNGNVRTDGGTDVRSNIEAAGTFTSGGSFAGTKIAGAAPRTIPSASAFDYYVANATAINYSTLSPSKSLASGVLSTATNSFGGGVNPYGIYVINCNGGDLDIKNSRICATIVVLNCNNLNIKGALRWLPGISTYPALLAQANTVHFKPDSGTLSEALYLTNFNPTGIPYPWPTGNTDITILDSYPVALNGLYFVNGDVTFEQHLTIGMVVCTGKIDCGSRDITFNVSALYKENPPPGFYTVDMKASPGGTVQSTN